MKDEFYKLNILSILLERFKISSIEIQRKILYCITNLCAKHKQNQNSFHENGGTIFLLDMLISTDFDEDFKSDIATTLWAVSLCNEQIISVLCEPTTFQKLYHCLILEPEKVLVGIVATFSNIADISSENCNFLREKSIIPIILDYLRGSYSPLLETTAGAVISLIKDNGLIFILFPYL